MNGVTIIPFRKGSTLKDKNFAIVGGMSLVERTLRQALDWLPWPVVLFTDFTPDEIEAHGCYLSGTPIVVPDTDPSGSIDTTLKEAVIKLQQQGVEVDTVAWMSPNQPVRQKAWLDQVVAGFEAMYPAVASSFIVEPTVKQLWKLYPACHPRLLSLHWECQTSGLHGERQTKAPEAYIEHTGTFLLSKATTICGGHRIGTPAVPVPVKHPYVGLDIHTQQDVDLANWLYEQGAWS